MNRTHFLLTIMVLCALRVPAWAEEPVVAPQPTAGELRSQQRRPYVRVLGISQDAGFPQAGCRKDCCRDAWQQPALRRYASCLAIVDPVSEQKWLLDCTPDFRDQLRLLETLEQQSSAQMLDGIFLTHAHIGHYAGLIHLGREVMGADGITVYAMPRMSRFLSTNGPWDQLVTLNNITLQPMRADRPVRLNERLSVTPLLVPHRDEYSETVGFIVRGPQRRVLYLPDIDKWEKWDRSIERQVQSVDVAYLDGTFFGNGEIPGRDMSQIPHPFIEESLQRFGGQPAAVRSRVRFIHFNHTNPALHEDSAARRLIEQAGCHMAAQGERQEL
ncbi:MAG: MBL fold metallo-hydrolase [Planctomycetaceae bacterium]|nr:MBL fold metallo-hydrolase [Planctomycetaceae bacterium]